MDFGVGPVACAGSATVGELRLAMSEASTVLKAVVGAQMMLQGEFDRFLLDSIDDALTDVLGRQFKEAVYEYIEHQFHIARSALPDRLDVLDSALSMALGGIASTVVGRAIAKRFYAKLGLQFIQKSNHSLLNYVTDARLVMRDY
jgi:hypothetical protein